MEEKIYKVTIRKKNKDLIEVDLPLDEGLYKAIKTLSKEEQIKYFTNEYHDYQRQRDIKRRHDSISIDQEDPELGFVHHIPDDSLNPAEYCLQKERDEFLANAILNLKPQQRKIVKSIYYDGKSQKEVANELGITKYAMSMRLKYILNNLKNELNGKI